MLKVPGDPLDDVADDAHYAIYTFITSTETPAQLAMPLEGINWRRPERTWESQLSV